MYACVENDACLPRATAPKGLSDGFSDIIGRMPKRQARRTEGFAASATPRRAARDSLARTVGGEPRTAAPHGPDGIACTTATHAAAPINNTAAPPSVRSEGIGPSLERLAGGERDRVVQRPHLAPVPQRHLAMLRVAIAPRCMLRAAPALLES